MEMEEIIGDYQTFFVDLLSRMKEKDIDVTGCPISHLGFRTTDFEEYEKLRDKIKKFCVSYSENEHNGRPISLLLLREPLDLSHGFTVNLIELIPPKSAYSYPPGLEHCGVVIGEELEKFAEIHKDVLTERKVHGPYCKPYYLTFDNGKRVKFYDLSLKDVVEKEGHEFMSV